MPGSVVRYYGSDASVLRLELYGVARRSLRRRLDPVG
jgi:hypothetical protein